MSLEWHLDPCDQLKCSTMSIAVAKTPVMNAPFHQLLAVVCPSGSSLPLRAMMSADTKGIELLFKLFI